VTWVLKSGLPYRRQARKNHEAIFMIKKISIKKINKRGSIAKKIVIKRIRTGFDIKIKYWGMKLKKKLIL